MFGKTCILYTSCLIFLFIGRITNAEEKAVCLNNHKELFKIKQSVMMSGGIWTVYEKQPEIRGQSAEGLKLDGEINRIVEISEYLCQTLDGVPLNGLAIYVLEHLKLMGEKAFRDQLINIRGKSEKDIEVWFNYAKLAIQFRNRTLALDSVTKTLSRAKEIILRYRRFVNDQTNFVVPDDLRKETLLLLRQINVFFKADPNMALAIHEKAQEPYWDISEGDVG